MPLHRFVYTLDLKVDGKASFSAISVGLFAVEAGATMVMTWYTKEPAQRTWTIRVGPHTPPSATRADWPLESMHVSEIRKANRTPAVQEHNNKESRHPSVPQFLMSISPYGFALK